MSIIHKCDKCGKEFDKKTLEKEPIYYSVSEVNALDLFELDDKDIDLCPSCSRLLREWLAEDPVQIGVTCEWFSDFDLPRNVARWSFRLSCGHSFILEPSAEDQWPLIPKRCPVCGAKVVGGLKSPDADIPVRWAPKREGGSA